MSRSLSKRRSAATIKQPLAGSAAAPDWRELIVSANQALQLANIDGAASLFLQALEHQPDVAEAWLGLGRCRMHKNDLLQAEWCLQRAVRFDPTLSAAQQQLVCCWKQIASRAETAAQEADWVTYDRYGLVALAGHRQCRAEGAVGTISPFGVLSLELTPLEQRELAISVATAFAAKYAPSGVTSPALGADLSQRRIRVGYLGDQWGDRATGHQIHRLFQHHDRDRFEVFVFSLGDNDDSWYRNTIAHATEHFVDISALSSVDAAQHIREMDIDILVDLIGLCDRRRAAIAAQRPAPIQVLWMAGKATTGAPWADYWLVDPTVAPVGTQGQFTEQLIDLPHSHRLYCGEDYRFVPTTRSAEGLPDDAMVYCAFSPLTHIDAPVFDAWMRTLQAVPSSVLWLIDPQGVASERMEGWAVDQGIDPDRLIFAPRKPKKDHLARMALADLFLDTRRANSPAYAGDALWAGLPVLSCPGDRFAQRTTASACAAASFTNLIVEDMAQYEQMAIHLGRHRNELSVHQQLLQATQAGAPLFDSERFARDLEATYQNLIERHGDK